MRTWRVSDNRPNDQLVHIDETVQNDILSFLDKAVIEKKFYHKSFEMPLSTYLTSDIATIQYRQQIINDLLNNDSLMLLLEELLGLCETWENIISSSIIDWLKLIDAIKYFGENVIITKKIFSTIGNISNASKGLTEFKDYLEENINKPVIREIEMWASECCKGDIPRSIRFALGINENYGIKNICLLSIDDLYYPGVVGGYGAYTRQFLKFAKAADILASGGAGRYVDAVQKYKKYVKAPSLSGLEPINSPRVTYDPLQIVTNPNDISESTKNIMSSELKRAVTNLKAAIKEHTRWLLDRKNDIAFFIRVVKICKYIDGLGFSSCFPKCCETDEKRFICKEMYPLDLAAKLRTEHGNDADKKLVFNDVVIDRDNCILLVTGINQGGKTTFLKSIAFIQFLFQIGIKVTCSSAELSPVDGIFSIFSREEDNRIPHGRLGQELNHIVRSFKSITSNSLVLLNEPFASTSADSAVFLCKEMLSLLLILKIRSVMVSHFYRLTYMPGLINNKEYETKITNMTTERHSDEKGNQIITYKIVKGVPEFDSHAVDAYKRVIERLNK